MKFAMVGTVLSTAAVLVTSAAANAATPNMMTTTVGNGYTQNAQMANASTGTGQGMVGVGALSGGPHQGSVATVSVLNTQRLVGLDLGPSKSGGTVSVNNPAQAPVLSPGMLKAATPAH